MLPPASRLTRLSSEETAAETRLVGRWLAAVLVPEDVGIHLYALRLLRLHAAGVGPVGEHLHPLRQLGVAEQVQLLLLQLGEVGVLALLEPHHHPASGHLER